MSGAGIVRRQRDTNRISNLRGGFGRIFIYVSEGWVVDLRLSQVGADNVGGLRAPDNGHRTGQPQRNPPCMANLWSEWSGVEKSGAE